MALREPPLLTQEGDDNDSILRPGAGNDAWIAVGPVALCIHQTSEGVIVDAWPNHNEAASDILGTMAITFEDAINEGGIACNVEHPETP